MTDRDPLAAVSEETTSDPGDWRASLGDFGFVVALTIAAVTGVLVFLGSIVSLLDCAVFYRGFITRDAPSVDCAAAPGWSWAIGSVVITALAVAVMILLHQLLSRRTSTRPLQPPAHPASSHDRSQRGSKEGRGVTTSTSGAAQESRRLWHVEFRPSHADAV